MLDTSRRVHLKQRLVKFWDSFEFCTDNRHEIAASLPFRERMASFVPAGSRILDVACGTTANAQWLAPLGTYFGIDISQGLLRLVHQRDLLLACADAESLPFGDSSFDAALLTFALEHSVDPVQVLKELCRVVRPKGRIIILGPTWDLPFWYPSALRSRADKPLWRIRYSLSRLNGQLRGWLFGKLPFLIIEEPDALKGSSEFDCDAVYVTWSFEVIRQMRRFGCALWHWETDTRLLGNRTAVRLLKRLMLFLPPYRYSGSTTLFVFENE